MGAVVHSAKFCCALLEAYVATVHEEGSVSAQPLGRQVEQVRLWYHGVVQVQRPLQTTGGTVNEKGPDLQRISPYKLKILVDSLFLHSGWVNSK